MRMVPPLPSAPPANDRKNSSAPGLRKRRPTPATDGEQQHASVPNALPESFDPPSKASRYGEEYGALLKKSSGGPSGKVLPSAVVEQVKAAKEEEKRRLAASASASSARPKTTTTRRDDNGHGAAFWNGDVGNRGRGAGAGGLGVVGTATGTMLLGAYNESVNAIDWHFRYAAAAVLVVYPSLVLFSYRFCPPDAIQRLEGLERTAPMLASALQLLSILSLFLPLLYRGWERAWSGVITGALVVQGTAALTNGIMAFAPVPVMIDPITGTRVHLMRWCEWTPLAFMMTFLTEGVDVPEPGNMRFTYLSGLSQGFSTLCGLIFPFCPGFNTWMFVMVVSFILFFYIYVRLIQKVRAHSNVKMGTSVDEKEVYNRSLLSLKLMGTCTFMWTMLVIVYCVSSICPMFFPQTVWLQDSALTMTCECFMDVLAKVLYMIIIIDVHDAVFDQGARAERRLEELRQMMAVVWDNSSDVIGISVRSVSGSVTTMLSPTYLKIYQRAGAGIEGHEETYHKISKSLGNALIFELDAAEFQHGMKEEKPERRRTHSRRDSYRTAQEVSPEVFDAAKKSAQAVARNVQPKIVSNIEFAASGAGRKTGKNSAEQRRSYGCVTGSAASDSPDIREEELSSIAELVVRSWDLDAKETLLMHDLILVCNSEELIIRCEAKVTRLEENALVIVVRDISERFRRFEAEKRVISETTARQKDAEANRFTRHEVKNGLLAAIGLCDSLGDTLKGESLRQDSATDRLEKLLESSTGESSGTSKWGDLVTDLTRCLGELDKTLHEVLDTILAEAMARDVIHEVYEPKLEKVDIGAVLCGSNVNMFSDSKLERFPLLCHPSPLPLFAFDPQLLKYIHRNAISNACKYGKNSGVVMTEVRFDESSGIFQMDVINLPGKHHDKILEMGDAASVAVFSPRERLHTEFHDAGYRGDIMESHSSGDGAWIMHKCAKTLGGECSIKFETHRTIFSFRCPVSTWEAKMSSSVHSANFKFPDNTWGIAIDDSQIQRKLLKRFLVLAGVKEERCMILGANAEELQAFDDFTVEHVESHPNDYFIIIADENLDVMQDATKHVTISGSMCIENIRHRLMPEQERRTLALVRSANDSSRDIAIYNSRAHGFLPKAPIGRQRVREMLAPIWTKRYPPGWAEGDWVEPTTTDSNAVGIDDDINLFVDMVELREEVEALNEMCSKEIEVLVERWPDIWERLHVLKGDLQSLPSNGRASAAATMISQLKGPHLPQSFEGKWVTIYALIKSI